MRNYVASRLAELKRDTAKCFTTALSRVMPALESDFNARTALWSSWPPHANVAINTEVTALNKFSLLILISFIATPVGGQRARARINTILLLVRLIIPYLLLFIIIRNNNTYLYS